MLVITQIICWIIRCAYSLDIELAYQRLAAELGACKFCVTFLENLPRGPGLENLVYAEDTAEFEMRPMIEGVSH